MTNAWTENVIFIFHKLYSPIKSICEMPEQFTKTICHYLLAEKNNS